MTQFIIFAYVKRYLDDKVWCCMDRITAGKHVSFLCTRVEMDITCILVLLTRERAHFDV